MMDLDAYLNRIDYRTSPKPDLATLTGLMQAHLLAVPFENLDVQLGVPVSTNSKDAFSKIVKRGRGGWCFEQNGLFKWVLEEIGFKVQSLAGYVNRVATEPPEDSSHLFLRVDCDEPLLVDVAYGGSLWAPMPLSPCKVEQAPYTLSIEVIDNGFLRWKELSHDTSSTLDFTLDPVGPSYFDATSDWLQSSPESSFTRTLTAQRRFSDKHVVLRGLVKRTFTKQGVAEETIGSVEHFVTTLKNEFMLDVPEIAGCWEKVKARHIELFGE